MPCPENFRACHSPASKTGMYISCKPFLKTVPAYDTNTLLMQVSVVSFKKGQLQVLAHAWDRNLGGRNFDEVLFEHFVKEFDAKYKLDIKSSPRACFRLRLACEKVCSHTWLCFGLYTCFRQEFAVNIVVTWSHQVVFANLRKRHLCSSNTHDVMEWSSDCCRIQRSVRSWASMGR
jgi:hypothetical protein